jgi:hypothetical protein
MLVGGWRGWRDSRSIVRSRDPRSALWFYLLRRDLSRLAKVASTLFVSCRARVLHFRLNGWSYVRSRGSSLSLGPALALLVATALTGCHSPAKADATTTYQAIRADLMHGDLKVAQQKVGHARQDFASAAADWPMKFLLLDAEIVLLEGRRADAIALLTNPGVSYPSAGDLAIKRDLLCGLAHLRLGHKPLRFEWRSLTDRGRGPTLSRPAT